MWDLKHDFNEVIFKLRATKTSRIQGPEMLNVNLFVDAADQTLKLGV